MHISYSYSIIAKIYVLKLFKKSVVLWERHLFKLAVACSYCAQLSSLPFLPYEFHRASSLFSHGRVGCLPATFRLPRAEGETRKQRP